MPVHRLARSLLSRPPSAGSTSNAVLYLVHITDDSLSRTPSLASPSGGSFGGRAREEEATLLDTFGLDEGDVLHFGGRGPSLPNLDVRRLTVPVNEGGLLETMQEHVSLSGRGGASERGREGGREGVCSGGRMRVDPGERSSSQRSWLVR